MGGQRISANSAPACEPRPHGILPSQEGAEFKVKVGKDGKEKRSWSGIVQKKTSERTGDQENAENGDAGHAKNVRNRRKRGEGATLKKEAGIKGRPQRKPLAERHAETSSLIGSSALSEKGQRGRPLKSVESSKSVGPGPVPSAATSPLEHPLAEPVPPAATSPAERPVAINECTPPVDRPLAINESTLGIGALIRLRDALTETFLVLPREGFGPTPNSRNAPSCPPLRICAAQLLAHVQIGLHPNPSQPTLNPKPSNTNPKPQPLKTRLFTCNPEHLSLSPEPPTLNQVWACVPAAASSARSQPSQP